MSLLSSTSQPGLSPLFTRHTDTSLPTDSVIICLLDSHRSGDTSKRNLVPRHATRGDVLHPVILIQSPTIRSTYIQAGCSLIEAQRRREKGKYRGEPLGIELEWMGLQLKRLGRREMSLEIGIVDSRGREGVVRCSSFQVS